MTEAPAVRTQAMRSAQARRRLIRAAIRLLARRGYTGTTLAEIGREAGVSRGLVTHHFGTKDACILAAIEEIGQSAGAVFSAGAEGVRGLARVEHLVGAYIGATRSEDEYHYLRAFYVVMADAISEAPVLRDAVARTNAAFRSQIRNWLAEAVEDGELPADTDLTAAAVLVAAVLRGVCLQWFVDPDRVDLDAATAAARRMVRAGLAVTPA